MLGDRRSPARAVAAALCLALAPGCGLLDLYSPAPPWCSPGGGGLGGSRTVACGPCGLGERQERCDVDAGIVAGPCQGNPLDLDGDGWTSEACRAGVDGCCSALVDCAGEDPSRFPGHADLDGDGHALEGCCAAEGELCDDCDDGDALRWTGRDDLDGDGHVHEACGGDDCDDDDPGRWTGHDDLDGDGHVHEACGGDDCDDDSAARWSGYADVDGDGHVRDRCGGDDCDDDDPRRWAGHDDLDGDGAVSLRCGGTDCNDDDGLRWDGHADADGDGYDDFRCGGEDCDDRCAECHPGATSSCGEGLDHDCDGVADEYTGCREVDPGLLCVEQVLPEVGRARGLFVTTGDRVRVFVASDEGLDLVEQFSEGTAWSVRDHVETPFGLSAVTGTSRWLYALGPMGLSVVERAGSASSWEDGLFLVAGPIALGMPGALALWRDRVLAGTTAGLHVLDVTSPWSPTLMREVSGGRAVVNEVFVFRGYAYLAGRLYAGDGAYPVALTGMDISGPEESWAVLEGFAHEEVRSILATDAVLLYATNQGLQVYSRADRVEYPWDFAANVPLRTVEDVFVVGRYAYVVGETGLDIVDLSEPTEPRVLPRDEHVDLGPSHAVFVSGDLLFVAGDDGLTVVRLDCGL